MTMDGSWHTAHGTRKEVPYLDIVPYLWPRYVVEGDDARHQPHHTHGPGCQKMAGEDYVDQDPRYVQEVSKRLESQLLSFMGI